MIITEDMMPTAWIMLLLAGLCEILWVLGLKLSTGFTKFWPSVGTIIFSILSLYCLSRAALVLPIGTAYAVWTGIGAAGIAVIGMLAFGEPCSLIRIACITLIILGISGLKLL